MGKGYISPVGSDIGVGPMGWFYTENDIFTYAEAVVVAAAAAYIAAAAVLTIVLTSPEPTKE